MAEDIVGPHRLSVVGMLQHHLIKRSGNQGIKCQGTYYIVVSLLLFQLLKQYF